LSRMNKPLRIAWNAACAKLRYLRNIGLINPLFNEDFT
jgi:hypothetical protein